MSIQVVLPIHQYAKTAAQLAADNFVHVNRQLVIASDTGVFKLGDGVTAYNSLPPLFSSGGGAWGSITGTLSAQTDLQAALNAKQATLISATNIKTINGSTILGSGDLTVSDSTKLPLAGGTMTGHLLFTDNTKDIGASGATRPRTGYFGTRVQIGASAFGSADPFEATGGVRSSAAGDQYTYVRLHAIGGTSSVYMGDGNGVVGRFSFNTSVSGFAMDNTLKVNGAVSIGNTVAAAAAVISTHKVTMVIGGTTYYLLASNV